MRTEPPICRPSDPILVPAPFKLRLIALLIDLAIAVPGCGLLGLGITMTIWAPLFGGGDFDGPEQLRALGAWTLLATWAGLVLAYTSLELFARRTPGMDLTDLHFVAPAGPARRHLMLRWLVAYLPLVLATAVFLAGAFHTAAIGWDAFEDHGWRADGILFYLAPLAAPWAAFFRCAAGPQKHTFAEQLTGTETVHALRAMQRRRGFEVLPVTSPPASEPAAAPPTAYRP